MEDQFHEQSTPGGHWIYQSDVSREDPRVTRLRSQQLYGNFYARGLDGMSFRQFCKDNHRHCFKVCFCKFLGSLFCVFNNFSSQ